MDDAPEGLLTVIGHTGTQSETLTLQMPASYANQSCTLCAYGMDDAPSAALFFWAPAAANQQRIVTYVLDSTTSVFARGFLTINTPTLTERTGSIRITKIGDANESLPGVSFSLYDSTQNLIDSGITDGSGQITFSGLTFGDYYYQETAALPGHVLDSNMYPVSVSSADQPVELTVTNTCASGSIVVMKTDSDTGSPLSGVHFILTDSSGATVSGGGTDENGVLTFSNLPLGTYTITETETRSGYILDSTPRDATIIENGQIVEISLDNAPARGSVSILKTDAETGAALAGVHFILRDEAGALTAEGDTGTDGTLTLPNIPVGRYTLQETATLSGYVLDETRTEVNITENGQIVEIRLQNSPIHCTLEIIKRDAHEDIALAGAGYRLFDSTGTQVAEGYTDASGRILFPDLPRGQYVYQEFMAPMGYLLDENRYSVSITENGTATTETRTDERRPGTLILTKQSADGRPLAGAAFLLEYSADQGSTWQPVFYRTGDELTPGGCTAQGLDSGQLTTGADGTTTFTGLRADGIILYRLTETKAPLGMTLMGAPIVVGALPVESGNFNAEDTEVIGENAYHYTLNVTVTDSYQYRLPETGGNDSLKTLPFAMMFMAAPIIFTFQFKRRRLTE